MNNSILRHIPAAILVVMLAFAWLAPLDKTATVAVDEGLKRSLVTFATARAINGALSVAESVQVSGGIGVSGTVGIGQFINPINSLVEQFAELMLAASVAFGVMKLALVIGGATGVSALLTLVAGVWIVMRIREKPIPRLLNVLLVLILFVRFAVPVITVGSERIFHYALSDTYSQSQKELSAGALEKPDWSSLLKKPGEYYDKAKAWIEHSIRHVVTLIALFLMETLIVPALLFWMLTYLARYAFARMPGST